MLAHGHTLNKCYEILRLLGKGGFGAVYQAQESPPLRRIVAVKQTLFPSDQGAVNLFAQEAELLANVDHSVLPRVYTYFEEERCYYLVMQYIEGQSLHEYVQGQPNSMLGPDKALQLIAPVVDALDYLHSQNPAIIHRDIKPANIRLTPAGKVYLVDFGIAKLHRPDGKTATAARAVSAGFSSYEQFSGDRTDARSDIYSLGATLYFMLSGVVPENAPKRVPLDPLVPLSQLNEAVSPSLEAAVHRMLALWPQDRYPDIAALQADLWPQSPASSPPVIVDPDPVVIPPPHVPANTVVVPTTPPIAPRIAVIDVHDLLAKLQPDVIVYGPMLPERLLIIDVIPSGTIYRLRGEGLTSEKTHKLFLSAEQLADLSIVETAKFDGDAKRFRLGVEALRLGLAYEYDRYFSLSIARVDPLPHQIEAVYDYFLKQPRIRFLLADDPGAGKTIMAGLLIKELKIRGLIQRVLIITPANLTFQWQRELKDKFREQFEVVRGDVLRSTYGTNPWQDKNQVITSISWVSRMDDARDSLLRSRWDLVIVDEAHKMSAYSEDKKTLAYQLGEALGQMTDHMLLLTATPHKGDPENFCLFLRLLDADVYGDVSSLEEAVKRHEAPFYLRRVKEALVSFPDPNDGQVKRLFTRRTVQTADFELNADEYDFYYQLTHFVEDQSVKAAANQSAQGRAVGFTMAMLQRRFASSTYAVRRSLERMKERREKILADPAAYRREQINRRIPENFDELPDEEQQTIIEELENVVATIDPDALRAEIVQLGSLISQAKDLEEREIESKLVKLKELLVQRGIFDDPTMKLLIFTEHRETLDYLVTKLRDWGLSVTQIYGGMPIGDRDTPGTRIAAERAFKESCQILVATEAAGEGINLQFCWLMINYDIPWNPVRLEQRMGRIHRYGQEKDCLIFNFVAKNTSEGRVLDKLFERIREIERALDPEGTGKVFNVLGDIFPANQLERMLRDMYARNLTEDVIKSRIVEQVDTERFQRITYSALEGLAKRELNLAALISKAAEAKERRLVPDVVRDFFIQAAPVVGLRLSQIRQSASEKAASASPAYRVTGIPRTMTAVSERLEARFGRLGQEYKQIVFAKEALQADPTLEWVTPGHPLFESLREDTYDHAQGDLQRGTLFFELQRTMPARLDVFAAAIRDGRGNVLEKRLYVVETRLDGVQAVRQPTLFLDLVPASEGAQTPYRSDLPDQAAAEQLLISTELTQLRAQVQAERQREITMVEQHTKISLEALIQRQQLRLAELWEQQQAGDESPLLAANLKLTEDRVEVLNARLERRLAELKQERYVSIGDMQRLGQAWVLPHPERTSELLAPLVSDLNIERIAVDTVTAALEADGWRVQSVETENRGFDLIARLFDPQRPEQVVTMRYIEVKGRSMIAEVALTNNEYKTAERLGEDYWLYVVYNCATQPELHIVRDPARLQWAEVLQVAHYRVGAKQIISGGNT